MRGQFARPCQMLALGITVYLSVVAYACAAEVSISFGAESFRWEEFDSSGAQIVKETGPRYRVGADWRRPIGDENQMLLDLRGSVYLGRVDYDGQACTISFPSVCNGFQTETDYFGAEFGATVARRFGDTSGTEIFAGGGVDSWRRQVKGRDTVRGAIEDWTTLYALAGVGGYWEQTSTRTNARVGVKYPFYVYEVPDAYDIVLHPEGRPSLFARVTCDFLREGKPRWGLGAYYDSYRFDPSDREQDGSLLVWQPESRQDVFGLFATIYLH